MKTKGDKKSRGRSGGVKTALLISLLIFSGLAIISIGTAAAAPTVKIEPASTPGLSLGDTFSINVSVDSAAYNLKACKIDLTYNASALTASTPTEGDLLGSPTLTEPGSGIKQPGWIHYGITRASGNTPVASAGTFITVEFTVNSTASNGTYKLDLSNVTLNDETNAEITGVEVTDGNAIVGEVITPTVKIEPETTTDLSPGGTFSINVSANSATYNLKACKIDLTYNASALTASTPTEGDLLGSPTLTEPGSGIKQPGWIHYGITRASGNTPVASAGSFITVEFTVSDTASSGTYSLDLSNVTLNDENNAEITGVEVTDGNAIVEVEVTPPTIISYTISNQTITPPQTTEIDVAFSEEVEAWIKIEDSDRNLVNELYHSSGVTNPNSKTWDGTYTNNTVVPAGDYYVNVSGTNTTTGLSVVNDTETITVQTLVLTNITVSPPTKTLNVSKEQVFTATAKDQNGEVMADINITWTSSNETVGNVSPMFSITCPDGTATTTFMALKAGTTTIRAENVTSGKYGTVVVNVTQEDTTPPTIDFIAPTPENGSTVTVNYVNVTVNAIDEQSDVSTVLLNWNGTNETMNMIADNTWSVNKTDLPNGDYTYRVYANDTYDNWGVSEARVVTVEIKVLKNITVSPATKTLNVSETQVFTATAKDKNGEPMSGINITWSSNETVGNVSPSWEITDENGNATTTFMALAAGMTTIKAENASVNGTAEVTVKVRVPGDVTGEGNVNIQDAILLFNWASYPSEQGTTYVLEKPENANVNGDTVTNIQDAILLFNWASYPSEQGTTYILQ